MKQPCVFTRKNRKHLKKSDSHSARAAYGASAQNAIASCSQGTGDYHPIRTGCFVKSYCKERTTDSDDSSVVCEGGGPHSVPFSVVGQLAPFQDPCDLILWSARCTMCVDECHLA
eukprot:8895039-Pyramimonas_sp.AAC.1